MFCGIGYAPKWSTLVNVLPSTGAAYALVPQRKVINRNRSDNFFIIFIVFVTLLLIWSVVFLIEVQNYELVTKEK